jgi:hypothetical protein
MVLGHVIAVKSGAIEQLNNREPLLVIIRKRQMAAVNVVEDAEFHCRSR